MKKIAIIGGSGNIGKTILKNSLSWNDVERVVIDILKDDYIVFAEKQFHVSFIPWMFSKDNIANLFDLHKEKLKDIDVFIGCLPGYLGFDMLDYMVSNGKTYVDVSFMPEDPMKLNEAASKNRATTIVDCGLAPGLSNLIVGHEADKFYPDATAKIYVGGLPQVKIKPLEYSVTWSFHDVIDEYLRKSRIWENKKIIEKEALTDIELLDFDGVGTLEAFNTDGLRTLIETCGTYYSSMVEKTLRYPGHANLMKIFRDLGLFSDERINEDGDTMRDFVTDALNEHMKRNQCKEDIVVMKVIVENEDSIIEWDISDKYETEEDTSAMSRTTGYTCAALVKELLDNKDNFKHGVIPLEKLSGKVHTYWYIEGLFERIVSYLGDLGIFINRKVLEK